MLVGCAGKFFPLCDAQIRYGPMSSCNMDEILDSNGILPVPDMLAKTLGTSVAGFTMILN